MSCDGRHRTHHAHADCAIPLSRPNFTFLFQGDEDDSAAAWVKKSRQLSKAKKAASKKAAKKAAELAAMDEEAEETGAGAAALPNYTADDLSGLTVRHDDTSMTHPLRFC